MLIKQQKAERINMYRALWLQRRWKRGRNPVIKIMYCVTRNVTEFVKVLMINEKYVSTIKSNRDID